MTNDVTIKLFATLLSMSLLAAPAAADESGAQNSDGGFFEDLTDDAGDFFTDVGDFFTEDVPNAFTGEESAKASPDASDPFAGKPRVLTDKASVRKTQKMLNAKGYEAGPADGLMGRKTRAAISKYQKDNRLRVTGAVTDHLLLHLDGVRPEAPSVAKVPKREEENRYYSRDREN